MEVIKLFFKRLFCKHNYVYDHRGIKTYTEADFSGDGCYNTWQEHYEVYTCTKCGKEKRVYKK